jgi:hypothetical protein
MVGDDHRSNPASGEHGSHVLEMIHTPSTVSDLVNLGNAFTSSSVQIQVHFRAYRGVQCLALTPHRRLICDSLSSRLSFGRQETRFDY